MKKILSLLIVVLLVSMGAYSQAPGIFNYQGVARNSVGNVLVNKTITLRLTIHDVTAAGAVVYQESRTVVTNPFGLFNVQVGSAGAANVTGTVAGVPWGVGAKFIQVEIDPNGGTTFINIGTAQIASVPYSLFSTTAGDLVLPFVKTQADAGTLFRINNSGTGISGAIMGTTSSNAVNAWGVQGQVNNTSAGAFSSGILGTNLSTSGNGIGVTGTQAGSGWGVYGTTPSGRGVYGATTTGVGVYGQSTGAGTGGFFTSASGLALNTAGGVRLTGINEALNRILTSDAAGNATWQNPAGVGIVTGSGTLNWIPKWTPSGTNLGNSIMEDRGINIVGVNVPAAYTYTNTQQGMEIYNTGAALNARIILRDASDGGDVQALVDARTSPTPALSAMQLGTVTNHPITFFSNGTHMGRWSTAGNLGIGTAAGVDPTSRLQVENGLTTTGTLSVNQSNAANTFAAASIANANVSNTAVLNASLLVSRGPLAGVTLTGLPSALTSIGGTGIGMQGNASTGVGTIGAASTGTGIFGIATTTGTGVYAQSGTGLALQTLGRVQIQGQGAGLNKILTSDATGNATWQTLGGGVGIGGSGTLNYVAKWTPDGFNLGNSQIRDDGTRVSVGNPAFNDPNSLNVYSTSVSNPDASFMLSSNAEFFGIYTEDATGKMHFTANSANATTATKIMTLDDNGVNGVGIGTVNPIAKLHAVTNLTTAAPDAVLGESDNQDALGVAVRGVITSTLPGGFSAGVRGVNNGTGGLGIGVWGSHSGSGWGVYGSAVGGIGVIGNANSGIGVNGTSNTGIGGRFTTTSGLALYTTGGVRLQGINEALNRVLTSDASGNATWQDASAAGIVSGSGTLNAIPKWTPDGTTLGNSRWTDDGTFMRLDGGGAASSLNLNSNVAVGNTSINMLTGGEFYQVQTTASGQLGFIPNSSLPATAASIVFDDDGVQGIGIGTLTPTAKLHAIGALGGSFTSASGYSANPAGIFSQSVVAANTAGVVGESLNGTNNNTGVFGSAAGGTVFNIAGGFLSEVAGGGTNIGVYSRTNAGQFAGWFDGGKVKITDGTEGAGKVFTSDASGVGSWQTNRVGISLEGLSSNIALPNFTFVPVNQWQSVLYEDGGANFTPGTGSYTVPVSGVYQLNASVVFNQFSSSGYSGLKFFINGSNTLGSIEAGSSTALASGNKTAATLRLNAGDVIQVQVFTNTGTAQTLVSGGTGTTSFSVTLIHN